MNYLGIDYGTSKVGLALSEGEIARPYMILRIEDLSKLLGKIRQICVNEGVTEIVLGFPSQDKHSAMAYKILEFESQLSQKLDLKIHLQDETLTSYQALRMMIDSGKKQRKRHQEDSFAAAIILQDYLDTKK